MGILFSRLKNQDYLAEMRLNFSTFSRCRQTVFPQKEQGMKKTAKSVSEKISFFLGIRIGIPLLLSACSTDSVPDEDFEAPNGNFPLLGNVPDRPLLPTPEELSRQQKRLSAERDQALEEHDAVIKSAKSSSPKS